jgi:hypothetical protein
MFCYHTFLWFHVFWYNFHNLFRHKSGGRKKGTFLLILNYKSIGFSSGSGFLRIDRFFLSGVELGQNWWKIGDWARFTSVEIFNTETKKILSHFKFAIPAPHYEQFSRTFENTPCLFFTYLLSATSNNDWNLFLFVFHFRSK